MIHIFLFILPYLHYVDSTTPYDLSSKWTYYIEAAREQTWPSCAYRFLSYSSSCNTVDLYNAVGINQEWSLIDAGDGNFYLKSSCGGYLSYSGDCEAHVVDMWPQAGVNQAFRFVVGDNTQFEYYIEAVGREQCDYRWMSFPVSCTTSSPDIVDLWHATGSDQRFRLHPVRSSSPVSLQPVADYSCADPYAWYSTVDDLYALQCTGGGISLAFSESIGPDANFKYAGDSIGGNPPEWAASGARWAPENTFDPSSGANYLFFSDSSSSTGGVHRIGYSVSDTGVTANAWDEYSSTPLDLGNTPGGEIDSTLFTDEDGRQYLLWKSDDNNVGEPVTRIWAQEVKVSNSTVQLLDSAKVVLDSTGMWWVDSWVAGGSLVEGPEVIKRNGYYFLFFAAGRYCENSYSEGVARSTSIWGPYQKLPVPFLSTGIVGVSEGKQLIGPGHGSFLQDIDSKEWYTVYHASLDDQCNRLPFSAAVKFGYDDWPYADF